MTLKKSEHGTSHIIEANGNIFLDLGFNKVEAEKLLKESNQKIQEK